MAKQDFGGEAPRTIPWRRRRNASEKPTRAFGEPRRAGGGGRQADAVTRQATGDWRRPPEAGTAAEARMKKELLDDPRLARYGASKKASDLDAWRGFAQLCLEAQRDSALGRLARSTGVSEGTLRAFANVGRWIVDKEWQVLLAWQDSQGYRLTKWHITYLAGRTASVRAGCLQAMRSRLWRAVKIRDWDPQQNIGRPKNSCTASASKTLPFGRHATSCRAVESGAGRRLAELAHLNVPGLGNLLTPEQLRRYRCRDAELTCRRADNRY